MVLSKCYSGRYHYIAFTHEKAKTTQFFEGPISDGKSSLRIYGFDSKVRRRLLDYETSGESLVLDNCEVKTSKLTNVFVTSRTDLEKSDKSYEIDKTIVVDVNEGKHVVIEDVYDLNCFERVTVEVQVSDVDKVMEVKGGKLKQDVIIKDCTGAAKLTLWEQDIDKLGLGTSYKLSGMLVREYANAKYLSTSLDSTITEIGDIADVVGRVLIWSIIRYNLSKSRA